MASKRKIPWDTAQTAFMRSVGRNIRDHRQEARMTLVQLANAVMLTQPTLTRIERGEQQFPISYLPRIAEALHVPVEALIPKTAAPKPG